MDFLCPLHECKFRINLLVSIKRMREREREGERQRQEGKRERKPSGILKGIESRQTALVLAGAGCEAVLEGSGIEQKRRENSGHGQQCGVCKGEANRCRGERA